MQTIKYELRVIMYGIIGTHHRLYSCKMNKNPSSSLKGLVIVAVLIVSSCGHGYYHAISSLLLSFVWWILFSMLSCSINLTAAIVALLPFCCNSYLPMDFFMKLSSPVCFVNWIRAMTTVPLWHHTDYNATTHYLVSFGSQNKLLWLHLQPTSNNNVYHKTACTE